MSFCNKKCGNAKREPLNGEACDDGNPINGDGCTNCIIDSGYVCAGGSLTTIDIW
jgi:cysteine-rich repeat protein